MGNSKWKYLKRRSWVIKKISRGLGKRGRFKEITI
jgi:hypothetical protein